jgi:hypothetical protein
VANYEICSPIRGGGDRENLSRCAERYVAWMREHGLASRYDVLSTGFVGQASPLPTRA